MAFCEVIYENGVTAIDIVDLKGIHTTLGKGNNFQEAFDQLNEKDQKKLISAVPYRVDQFSTCYVIWSSII